MITVSLILTLTRLLGALFVLPFFLTTFLPLHSLWYNALLTSLFIVLGLTDFFDGYYARKFNQVTLLGALIDPLADKIFVMATLISLLAIGKLYFYWVVFFIAREFFVMGIREVALHNGFSIPVAYSGKIKTAVQMLLLAFLIFNPYQALGSDAPWWNGIEFFLLGSSFVLVMISAMFYFCSFHGQLKNK